MQNVVLTKLRSDFSAAISSDQNDVTLDPSIAGLLDKISQADFLEQFSIYSRGHLRKMGDFLSHIGNVQLKEDPARVACAVDEIGSKSLSSRRRPAKSGSRRLVQGRLGRSCVHSELLEDVVVPVDRA